MVFFQSGKFWLATDQVALATASFRESIDRRDGHVVVAGVLDEGS